MTNSSIGSHIQAFFADYLTSQRDMSPHTIASYRDSVKLLLAFAAHRRHKEVAALTFEDLGPDVVLEFLDDIEKTRGNATRTRNARLAAIHTLFGYVAAHEPQLLGLSQRICAIPVKKTMASCITYLDYEEVLHILASIDQSRPLGRRDYLLILLLFETGARASELVSLRTTSLPVVPEGLCRWWAQVVSSGMRQGAITGQAAYRLARETLALTTPSLLFLVHEGPTRERGPSGTTGIEARAHFGSSNPPRSASSARGARSAFALSGRRQRP